MPGRIAFLAPPCTTHVSKWQRSMGLDSGPHASYTSRPWWVFTLKVLLSHGFDTSHSCPDSRPRGPGRTEPSQWRHGVRDYPRDRAAPYHHLSDPGDAVRGRLCLPGSG